MEGIKFIKPIKKHVVWFFIIYGLIWIAPGIIVHPIDFISEAITGIKYVDGWTHGMMAWTGSVIIFPIAFLIFMGAFYLSTKERSQ